VQRHGAPYTGRELARIVEHFKQGGHMPEAVEVFGRSSGSISAAIKRHTGKSPTAHRIDTLRAKALRLERQGKSDKEIGALLGVGSTSAARYLSGQRTNGKEAAAQARSDRNDLIYTLRTNGMPTATIASSLNLSVKTVRLILTNDPRTIRKPHRRVGAQVVGDVIARCEAGELLKAVAADVDVPQPYLSRLIRQRLGRSLREHLQLRKQRATVNG